MKNRILLLVSCISISALVYGQAPAENDAQTDYVQENTKSESNFTVNAGVLMGGGSLVGFDIEYMIPATHWGFQIGTGIGSFGGGINYHLKDKKNSSFISLQYLHLGVGNILEKGPRWKKVVNKTEEENATVALLYNIGIYF
jgi:hypothetical protein